MAKSFIKNRFVFALLLIAAGSFILLKNLNVLPFDIPSYVFTWKMLLVVLGLMVIINGRENLIGGLLLISIGGYFLLPEAFGFTQEQVNSMWPVLLVLIGIAILVKPSSAHRKKEIFNKPKNENTDFMDNTVIFGGDSKQISSYDFKGGKVTAIFGGIEIDLSNCCLSKENKWIDFMVVCGGVSLKVPKEWNVQSEITPIMGGVEDNINEMRDVYIDPAAELILRGTVVMGGLEIKRV